MLLFLILPFVALAYTAWHIWLIVPLGAAWRWTIAGLWVAAFCTAFFNFSRAIDRFPMWIGTAFYEIGNSAIIVLLYLVMAFVAIDLLRLVCVLPRGFAESNAWLAVGITVALVVLLVCGNIHYKHKARQVIEAQTEKPIGSDSLTIVVASDLHLGYHNRREELSRWIDMINREKPDLVLFGGDIVDISVRPLAEEGMAEEFRRIEAPMYACFGNHEYYAGVAEASRFYADAGIHLLRDSVATVGGLTIIGRDDRSNPHRESLAKLMQGVDKSHYLLLLDHQPYRLEQAEQAGIDFQFSGHTHNGQVWPGPLITRKLYECAFGEYRKGATYYYVSSGMGIWGGKFRIGTRSEYVVMKLKQNRRQAVVPRT